MLYELYADDTAIGARASRRPMQHSKVAAITARLAEARHEAALARATLHAARRMLATRLAAWYRQGSPPDAVEIFLGAGSLSSAIDEIQLWQTRDAHGQLGDRPDDGRGSVPLATRSLASARAAAIEHHDALRARIRELEQAHGRRGLDLLDSLRQQARAAERRRIVAARSTGGEGDAANRRASRPPPRVQTRRRSCRSRPALPSRPAAALRQHPRRLVDRLRPARHTATGSRRPGRVRGRPLGDPARHALRRARAMAAASQPTPARRRRRPDRRLGAERGGGRQLGPPRCHHHVPVSRPVRYRAEP